MPAAVPLSLSLPSSRGECDTRRRIKVLQCTDIPWARRNPLADGWHLFKLAAVDMDGQQDPEGVEAVWKLDTVAPKTFLDAVPTDPSPQTSATFEVRPLRTR